MPKSPEHKRADERAEEKAADTMGAAAGPPEGANGTKPAHAPGVVAPSTRVNVSLPFSQIKLQEPSKELAELAALVHDLVVAMADWVPEDRLEELQARARALRDSLR